MSCCGSDPDIGVCAPWANASDVKRLMTQALGCCKGAVINAMNPVATPAAAMTAAFPTGIPGGACACEVIWLTAPDGRAWGSWDGGTTFKLIATAAVAPVTSMGARVSASAGGSVGSTSFIYVPFNTVERDTTTFFNIANPTRLTIPVNGAYMVLGQVKFIHGDTTRREIILQANSGGSFLGRAAAANLATPAGVILQVSYIGFLNAGQYLELMINNPNGSSVSYDTLSFLSIERIGT